MQDTDTIAAIASALNDAGIGIVRVSGRDAIAACEAILSDASGKQTLSLRKANTIRFGYVLREDGEILDEALISVLRAPFSYTGEDTVEINVHGGAFVLRKTLQRVLTGTKGRIRLARPGEFTKRAFFNGKIDLTKAEAVQDIISSQNAFALKNAARQLSGVLGDRIRAMRAALLAESALIEASLDDPDVYASELDGYAERLSNTIGELKAEADALLQSSAEGVLRKDGIPCAIVGAPNTGKSTLLNALLGKERAIVTDIPGTTRDVLREQVMVGEWMLLLSDTAGMRETPDPAEQIGVARAKEEADSAALLLLVADMTKDISEAGEVLSSLPKELPVICLLNKKDLLEEEAVLRAQRRAEEYFREKDNKHQVRCVIATSFTAREGLDALSEGIDAVFLREDTAARGEYYLTNERHREALLLAKEAFARVEESIRMGVSEEFYTVDLLEAAGALGSITGEDVTEELIDKIFSEFCMGK